MAKLFYQGHGSYRIHGDQGTVIYVDPFAGKGYDIPADIILITHQHPDHNQIQLVPQAKDCVIISNQEALSDNKYQSFSIKGIQIEAVPAYNPNHKLEECVGYVLSVDGIKIYASGDTSTTLEMKTLLPEYQLDYALLPIDGRYNMDAKEASACAAMIGAKHNIPIHMKPGELFDRSVAETFTGPNRLIIEPGQEIALS